MQLPVIALAALLLAGCATSAAWEDLARQQMAAGQCNAARATVYANQADPGAQAGEIGAVFAECDRNMAEAVRFWTISARYGNGFAQQTLAKLGKPVPAPDLQQAQGPGAVESFMQGYNQGRTRQPHIGSPSGSATCDARQTSMGTGMNQRYEIRCR